MKLTSRSRVFRKRIYYFIRTWPRRVLRFFRHSVHPLRWAWYRLRGADTELFLFPVNPLFWLLGLCLLLFDLIGIPEIFETLADLFKPNIRSLGEAEVAHYKQFFGHEVEWSLVRIDTRSRLGPRQYRLAYVSFHTVNSWGPLSPPVFVHELVHVWQYQKFGSLYIALALQAQLSKERYDYGGIRQLTRQQEKPFQYAFNFEQQAEIVEDFYRSKRNMPLQWSQKGVTADYWLTYWVRRGLTGSQYDPTE